MNTQYIQNTAAWEFLYQILETPTPTGQEMEGQRLWATYMAQYTDTQDCDAYGTAWAVVEAQSGKDAPTLLLDAHADEIGYSIRMIDDNGFARVERVGGSDVAIARGRRLCFMGTEGEVQGIIGNTAIHLRAGEDKAPKLWDLYVDFGCDSKEELEALGLNVGDIGVYCDGPLQLTDKRLTCRALDDKLCGFILTEVARRLHESGKKPAWNIVFANTVQEETGGYGARMLSYRLNPSAAICLDVTHAIDSPGLDKNRYGDIKLGAGPVLTFNHVCHPNMNGRLLKVCEDNQIDFQREACGRGTGTNTDSVFDTRAGIPATNLSLPLRYMHSPVELADMGDVVACADLLLAFIQSLDSSDCFAHRL